MIGLLPLLLAVLPAAASHGQSFETIPGSLFPPTQAFGGNLLAQWPQFTIGSALEPQKPDAELQEMLAEVDTERIKGTIHLSSVYC